MNRSEWKQYILETYHAVSDRPWPRYPNHEVFRHPGNRKWFALMLEVPGERLGLPERGMLDILNLKCDPVLIASLRGAPGLLPAYHMNKENWITAVLDSGAPDAQIRTLLAVSYDMTAPGAAAPQKSATRIRQRPGICGKISVSNGQEAWSMAQWHRNIQDIITIMDGCIRTQQDEALTLLASIPGKLDDAGGENEDAGSGQLMAWINEPTGRICSWGISLAEAYGVRLPADYAGPVPAQMQLMDVPAGEYLVFEHGPFDFETQNTAVEAKVELAMRGFDYAASGYRLDLKLGRVFYFYHDCARFFKYVRPVCRA